MADVSEQQIIDSDNGVHDGLSRCGCPSGSRAEGWRQTVFNPGLRPTLIAECQICGATWEWGEVCAVAPSAREIAEQLSDFFMRSGNYSAVRR